MDDQRAQRSVLASAELDWDVDVCDSAQSALDRIRTVQPHCVVLDSCLADMSGLECFDAIRHLPDVIPPVLMLITHNDEATALEALRVGIQDYLFKDARGNYLALLPAVLRKLLHEHRTAREKLLAQAAQQESEARFRGAFDNAPIGMALVSLQGKWLKVNQTLCASLGYAESELLDTTFQAVTHPDDLDIDQTFMQLVLANQLETYQMETRYLHKDGRALPVRISFSLVHNAAGNPLYFIARIEDLSQRRPSEDTLSGLSNRVEFELSAARLLHSAKTMQRQHALLFLELDQFASINERCGHLAGDQLLRQVSSVLSGKMRKSDMLARLGGDEFGILLEGCQLPKAEEIAQQLVNTVRVFRFEWKGKQFSVGIRIGLVAITEQSKDIQSLLRDADAACHAATDKGRNRIQSVTARRAAAPERNARIDWAARLQVALDQGGFQLHYQSIVPLRPTADPPQHEVLLRYRDEQGQLLLPMTFIPAAERCGMLPAIDRWVVAQVLRKLPARWFAADAESFIAINLSGASIVDPHFQEFVLQELQMSSMPPGRICFEITEAAAIAHFHRTLSFMQALKAAGCQLALDDFGGSLGSFAYLKSLPVDYLKIDGGIIKGIADDPVDQAMAESIRRIAQAMRIQSIAKHVESERLLPRLHEIGIRYGQGFCFHQPEPM